MVHWIPWTCLYFNRICIVMLHAHKCHRRVRLPSVTNCYFHKIEAGHSIGHCHKAPVSTWQSTKTICGCMSGYTLTHGGSRTQAFAVLLCQRFLRQRVNLPVSTKQKSACISCLTAGQPQHKSLTQSTQICCCRRLPYTCKSLVFPKNQLHAT